MDKLEIALGALLHDVGKFSQRAHGAKEGLSPQSLGMTPMLCPSDRKHGGPTHEHVLYTNEFAETMPFVPERLNRSRVANLASYHHRPDTAEQQIIAKADRLSSGMERYAVDEEREAGGRRFRRVRLHSVASTVNASGAAPPGPAALPLSRLSPEGAFPIEAAEDADLTSEYRRLWEEFLRAWAENRCPAPLDFINRAALILECYTWCIPSATNVVPDISLYDHLKTTAATAVCLHQSGERAKEPFLLVAADLTGIQKYVFDIRKGTGGLARRLRARSFKVAAYLESVSLELLSRLQLPLVHRILFAGGKFHLLLPNTEEVARELSAIEREASVWLFDHSAGEVGLTVAAIAMGEEGLKDFAESVARLNASLRESRDRAGQSVLVEAGSWNEGRFVLPRLDVSAAEELCEACQRRRGQEQKVHDTTRIVCDDCLREEDLGRLLPGARYVAFAGGQSGRHQAPVGSFDLVRGTDAPNAQPRLILDLDGAGQGHEGLPVVGAFRGRYVPHDPETGHVTEFKEIAARSLGDEALGYLKMDVDNLGYVFSQGLKGPNNAGGTTSGREEAVQDRTSISRVATLSRTLETFFSGYLEWLLRNQFQDVYLVYSGGDDVLAVGPWNQMFDLALRVREDFRRFTGGNRAWTLSAGVAVVNQRVPLLTATEQAEALLEASKVVPGSGVLPWPLPGDHRGEPCKDRITVFGTSIPWGEFPTVLGFAKRMLRARSQIT